MKPERPFARRRREAGLDLHQAAIRLRVSSRYLRWLELGHGPLSFALAHRMAAEYGVPVNALTRTARAGGPGQGADGNGNSVRPPRRMTRQRHP